MISGIKEHTKAFETGCLILIFHPVSNAADAIIPKQMKKIVLETFILYVAIASGQEAYCCVHNFPLSGGIISKIGADLLYHG